MARILFDSLLREVASIRLTQTNGVEDRRTDYDANCPKEGIPTFCAVIFYVRHDEFSDWRAIDRPNWKQPSAFHRSFPYRLRNRLDGSVPSDCFRTTALPPKMVSSAGFEPSLHERP